MREQDRETSRLQVLERIEKIVTSQGFGPVLMGWGFSRSFKISAALLVSLSIIPVCILGFIGYLKIPLDVISAPAVNLAIGMGVDAMIYLLVFARRLPKEEQGSWKPWSRVCSRLWQPIGTSLVIVCSGFGIFLLSAFPPTQRFGFSVVLGSLVSALVALFLFPWLASISIRKVGEPYVD